MSTKGLNTGIDNLFNLKPGTAKKHHDRNRSKSIMHQLLKPKEVDQIGGPRQPGKAPEFGAFEQEARDEEIRRQLRASQGGYASTILSGGAGVTSGASAASRVLYG